MSDNLPSTEGPATPMDRFRENIIERIGDDFAKLMPDEMLRDVIEESVKKSLYTNVGDRWNTKHWIDAEVQKQVSDKLKVFVLDSIQSREEEFKTLVADEIRRVVPLFLSEIIIGVFRGNSYGLLNDIEQKMRSGL